MDSVSNKILMPSSFVNEYEVDQLEAHEVRLGSDGLTDKKMRICFETFDNLIPKLGIFQKVIKAVRDDLYDGVYSNQFTSSIGTFTAITRVPFFELVNRVNNQRDENAAELHVKIRELEKKNKASLDMVEKKNAEICKLLKASDNLTDQLKDLRWSLKLEEKSTNTLQSSIKKKDKERAEMEDLYNEEVNCLKTEVDAFKEESEALRVYKDSYDELRDAFEKPTLPFETSTNVTTEKELKKKETENFRIAQIKKDLSVMENLEHQLHFVRNCAIQEYDEFLENSAKEEHKPRNSLLLMKVLRLISIDDEIEQENEKLLKTQKTFSDSILDINEELKLLLQHRGVLQAELARLEQDAANKKEARKDKENEEKENANDTEEMLEELDLVEIMVGNTEDPFIPHENILNKYSSMVYTSCNDGKTFYEIRDATFCESCGVKALICPHFVNERERIISLPKNCTHIKVVRPKVKIRRKRKSKKTKTPEQLDMDGKVVLPRLQLVWDDFVSRTNSERQLQRFLTEDFTLSIIDQFYKTVIWKDEYQSADDETYSFLNAFYNFLHDRYILDDAVYLVFYDIIQAVEKYASKNKQIHMFAACLDGTIDAAAFRYVLLMTEYINSFIWSHMQDFSSFATIIYPFLTEDDLEQLRMGYTSFSENKVSAHLVYNYLLYIILTCKEPRFLEFESRLLQCPVRKPGYFTDIEFAEAIDSFVPLASERLLHRLFTQSVKHFPEANDTVNVGRISHISSYLALIQDSPRIRNDIRLWRMEKEK